MELNTVSSSDGSHETFTPSTSTVRVSGSNGFGSEDREPEPSCEVSPSRWLAEITRDTVSSLTLASGSSTGSTTACWQENDDSATTESSAAKAISFFVFIVLLFTFRMDNPFLKSPRHRQCRGCHRRRCLARYSGAEDHRSGRSVECSFRWHTLAFPRPGWYLSVS